MNSTARRARSLALNPTDRLTRDAAVLGITLTEPDARRLLLLLDELAHWNRSFNLTAITEREAMITHHLLDSLSIHRDLRGEEVADVGTGAGFPGLPLAVVNPQRRFTLIDGSAKKIRFVANTAERMGLTNVDGRACAQRDLQAGSAHRHAHCPGARPAAAPGGDGGPACAHRARGSWP